jgi:UDP-glucose 4-epimerase
VFPVNYRYYHNITSNTLGLLEAMVKYDVKTLIYSSTCATYGEPETMPITEITPQVTVLYTSCISLYCWDVSLCLNLAL